MVDSSISTKDDRIDGMIAAASRWIEDFTRRRFIPTTATKEFDYAGPGLIWLNDDLLAVTSIKYGDQADHTIPATDYFLYPANALDDDRPYTHVEVNLTQDMISYKDTPQQDIQVVGKWGYSELSRVHSTLNEAGFTATDTTMTVASGTDFQIGHTLLVDTEQMWVSNKATNDLTVTRGVNGTTGATHSNGANVSIIRPPANIEFACQALVARWIHRGDSAWADRVGSSEMGYTYMGDVPGEVREVLLRYRRVDLI